MVLVGAAPSPILFFSCHRSLSLPRLAWSSTLMPPPRRKNVDAERCTGDLEVPLLNHFSLSGGKLDSSSGARLVVDVEEEGEDEEHNIVRHEKIRAEDRCTRQGSPFMFALAYFSPRLRIPFFRKAALGRSLGRLWAH